MNVTVLHQTNMDIKQVKVYKNKRYDLTLKKNIHRPTCLLFKFCIATPRLWPGSAALPNGSFRLGEGINGEVWASSASPAS